MTRRAYLYFVLTFILGVIVGSAGLFSYAWYGGHWHRTFDPQHAVRYLTRELNLTGPQVQELTPIVAVWAKKQADLKSQVDPQFRALREEFHNQVRQILSPEQTGKFNELVRRHDERRKPRK